MKMGAWLSDSGDSDGWVSQRARVCPILVIRTCEILFQFSGCPFLQNRTPRARTHEGNLRKRPLYLYRPAKFPCDTPGACG